MRRVLIIDNDPDVCYIVQIILESEAGWATLMATSGQDGLRTAQRERPDAVLLDVMMPDIDGLATLKDLRADPTTRQIPVILFSSTDQLPETQQQQFMNLSISGLIQKPLGMIEVVQQIRSLLNWND